MGFVTGDREFMRRTFTIWLIGAPMVAVFVWLAALQWRGEVLVRDLRLGTTAPASAVVPPLMEAPWRAVARAFMSADVTSEPAERALHRALALRPLYAPAWFDLARMHRARQDADDANRLAAHARALWPAQPALAWNVANLFIATRQGEAALSTLRDFWRLRPWAGRDVLALASFLVPDYDALYETVVPEPASRILDADHYANQFQQHARRTRNPRMAMAGWRHAPDSLKSNPDFAIPFVDFMIARGSTADAAAAWREFTGEPLPPGELRNAGFEAPRIDGGFGWRFIDAPGARSSIDPSSAHGGHGALNVAFDGSENLNFHHVRQAIVVEPAARYRLEGWWRGENVSTRSGVFVDIRALHVEQNNYARSEARFNTWDWQRFEIEFESPPDATLAELRVRRNPTDALDSRIAGQVWFDDFVLTRIER